MYNSYLQHPSQSYPPLSWSIIYVRQSSSWDEFVKEKKKKTNYYNEKKKLVAIEFISYIILVKINLTAESPLLFLIQS